MINIFTGLHSGNDDLFTLQRSVCHHCIRYARCHPVLFLFFCGHMHGTQTTANLTDRSPLEWSPVNLLIILYSVERINWLWGGQIHNSVKLKCFVSRSNFILIYLPASKTINPCTVSECYGTLNPILPPLSWSVIHRESDGYNMRKSLSLLTYRHLTHLPAIDTVPHR